MNMQNMVDPDPNTDPKPRPYSPPNEVPGSTPDEVSPGESGDTDYPGSIPEDAPVESPPPESQLLN